MQFMCIMETNGIPPERLAKASSWKEIFFDKDNKPIEHINERGKLKLPGTKPLSKLMEKASSEF